MKKIQNSRKLNLNPETLISLNIGELDNVNGGITPTIVVAISGFTASLGISQALCPR